MIAVSGMKEQVRHILSHGWGFLRLLMAFAVCACLFHSIDAERYDCGDLRGCASAAFPSVQVVSTHRLQRLLFAVAHDYELPEYSLEREKRDTHEVADVPDRRRLLSVDSEPSPSVEVEAECSACAPTGVCFIKVSVRVVGMLTAPAEFMIGHPKCAPPVAFV